MLQKKPSILLIKHGALGDFIQSFPTFQAVRQACPMAHIALLCQESLKEVAALSPYFDEILIDNRERPGLSLKKWRSLLKCLSEIKKYDLILDLQNSLRSGLYLFGAGYEGKKFLFSLLRRKIIGPKKPLHALISQKRLLEENHIPAVAPEKADWLIEAGKEIPKPLLQGQKPYLILAVETGEKHLYKSWPLRNFLQLAFLLQKEGYVPVLTGLSPSSEKSAERLKKLGILDLRGKTSLPDLARLMSGACLAIGADTGIMHLASFCACPVLVLFSSFSDPRFHSPIPLTSGQVMTLQARDTASLSFRLVLKTALQFLKKVR